LKRVPSEEYSIDDYSKENALCLYEDFGVFLVTYNEKSRFTVLSEHKNESEACEAFLHELL